LLLLRHALAPSPASLRVLTSERPPATQAQRLAALDTTAAASWMRAVRLAEAGDYEQAATVLRTTRAATTMAATLADQLLVDRRRLVWQARVLHRAGLPAQAETLARRAARVYLRAGDNNTAAALSDFVAKMRWIQQRAASD
jgi:hypothetical protein